MVTLTQLVANSESTVTMGNATMLGCPRVVDSIWWGRHAAPITSRRRRRNVGDMILLISGEPAVFIVNVSTRV
eukprot:scaffold742_cov395-Prasinococcus_capsulatus_cf.AAC.24